MPRTTLVLLLSIGCSDPAPAVSGDAQPVVAPDVVNASPDVAAPPDLGPAEDAPKDVDVEDTAQPMPALSLNAVACDNMAYWPHQLASETRPFMVHYQQAEDLALAEEIRGHLDAAWGAEIDGLGFREPPPDEGLCGPDARLDVFVWAGQESAWVDVLDEYSPTPFNDQVPYMAVDPWSEYGGALLKPTLFHELNHAFQAADDWFEPEIAYEMTATFVEGFLVPDNDEWRFVLDDFQAHPDWTLFRSDDYETWYMYGASLYLHFLVETVFDGDASFTGAMWKGMRGPPKFTDALDDLLAGKGSSLFESVTGFAAWRWSQTPAPAVTGAEIEPEPMLLGSAYVEVPAGAKVEIVGPDHKDVEWVLQQLDGAVVITAVPTGPYNPSQTGDKRYEVALNVVQ